MNLKLCLAAMETIFDYLIRGTRDNKVEFDHGEFAASKVLRVDGVLIATTSLMALCTEVYDAVVPSRCLEGTQLLCGGHS